MGHCMAGGVQSCGLIRGLGRSWKCEAFDKEVQEGKEY